MCQLTPVARRLPTDDPQVVMYLRAMYIAGQALSFAIYYYITMKVGSSPELKLGA